MSVRKRVATGIKWTTTGSIVLAITGLLKIAVLARFLDKEDFGLMALVTFVLGFMNLFMDMGLTSAILHKQNITKHEYASLYWINILISILLFSLVFLVSPFIAQFYGEPELSTLIPLMGVSIIFSAFGKQFKTIEQKEMNFKYISITDIIGAIAGLLFGIILAVKGFGVYSLIYAALLQYGISNCIYFIKGIQKQGMLFHFNYTESKPFLKIGAYFTGSQLINYFSRDVDILIIGKFFSTEILGGYSLAKQLISRPRQIIGPIINRVALSVFPKFQNDNGSLRIYFMKLFNGLGPLYAFIYGVSAIFAPLLVLMFYGPDFSSIVIYVQLLALWAYLRSMAGNVGILTITTGRTDYDFFWNVMTMIIMPLVVYIGTFFSIEMIILFMGITQLLLLFPCWYMFYYRLIDLKAIPFLKSQLIPVFISVCLFYGYSIFGNNLLWVQVAFSITLLFLLGIYSYFSLTEFRYYLKNLFSGKSRT